MKDSEVLLDTKRFRVVRQNYETTRGQEVVRETVEHPGAVIILPLLAEDRVCLIRNYRHAVGETLIELPAGTLEPGEEPLETAHRELIEETGYRAAKIEPLHTFFASPGILTERMYLFAASELTAGEQQLEDSEEIERLEVTWSQAIEMVHRQEIKDAKTLVGLLFYDRFLRERP